MKAQKKHKIIAVWVINFGLLSGCEGPPPKPPTVCSNPKSCLSFTQVQDNSCLLPNDPSTAKRYKISLNISSWGSPNKDLQVGIVRQKWDLNGTKISETQDNLASYTRNSHTELGCSNTIENGKLIELRYDTYCVSFAGDPCIASKGTNKIATSFPSTCPISVNEATLGSAMRNTAKLLKTESNYPIETSKIATYFTNQPITCEREKISIDPGNSTIIWNTARQTCVVVAKETIQGQPATLSVIIPTTLKAEKTISGTDITFAFFENYAPIVRSDDNENVGQLIGGTMSGLRLRKNSSDAFIQRNDGSTTCITLVH